MTKEEQEATRKRLLVWKEAGRPLESHHWRELKALTEEQALRMTRALLSRQVGLRPRRDTSGLVEQQALFLKTRRR